MKNWYKRAKMADKSLSPTYKIYSQCMYCKRWATYEGGDEWHEQSKEEIPIKETSPDPSQYIWKKQNQLNEDEKNQAYIADLEMKNRRDSDIGISHGICPYCASIIKKDGFPMTQEEIKDLIQKSLPLA